MTDNEIIKALECCAYNSVCDGCPLQNYCKDASPSEFYKTIFDLITRQKAEIDELKLGAGLRNNRKYYRKFVKEVFQKEIGNDLTYPDFDYIYQLYFEQKAEIERLNKILHIDFMIVGSRANGKTEMMKNAIKVRVDAIKAEAIKEFAERYESKLNCIPQHHFTLAQVLYDLDKTKKEMVGDVW